jgi:glyoxylase-like metal-dependent hydrolase (beta-lactamase superfamily II)
MCNSAADPRADAGWRTWHASGPEEVAPGVHRIPLPLPQDGLRAVNVYAVESDRGVTLVDAGWAFENAESALAAGLRAAGHDLADVTDFLVTHAHRDHYTLAVTVRRRLGTRIRIGLGERPNFIGFAARAPQDDVAHVGLLRLAGAGKLADVLSRQDHSVDKSDWELPDEFVVDGAILDLGPRRLRAIHTPGHTIGHFVYHDEERSLLFSGDHVLPHITPSIAFEEVPPQSPLSDYLASLQLMRELPDALLLPGHGPAGLKLHQRVDELLEHHGARLDATLKAIADGATTAFDVARQLTWTSRDRRLDELDQFNVMLAIVETYWHLEVLAERGAVRRDEADGAVHYTI